jgi:hypothetical protein
MDNDESDEAHPEQTVKHAKPEPKKKVAKKSKKSVY